MLPVDWRRRAHRGRGAGKAHRAPDRAHFSHARMLEFYQCMPRLDLRVVDHLRQVVDGADRDVVLEQERLPFLVGSREKHLLQRRDQAVAVFHAVGGGAVARIVREFGAADGRTELAPQFLAGDRQREVPRFGVKRLVGDDHRIGGAHGLRNFAVREIIGDGGAEQ
ncbi:hypothetical protein D3C83_10810 [compost metagenome]